MSDDADREVALFSEAIKVAPENRPAFLDYACDGDEELRHKVEALLRAHERVGDFLEEPREGSIE